MAHNTHDLSINSIEKTYALSFIFIASSLYLPRSRSPNSFPLPMAAPFSSSVLRARFPVLPPTLEVDHLVVGGGVIGLAIAERLVKRFPNRSTYLVEKHDAVGQETR